jgi:hypothetical protein
MKQIPKITANLMYTAGLIKSLWPKTNYLKGK